MSGAWVALQVFSSAEMFPFLLSKYFHSHNEKVKLFRISQSFMPIKAAIKLLPGYTLIVGGCTYFIPLSIVSICIHSNCCSIQLSWEFEPQKSRGIHKKRNTKNTRNRNENKSIDSARWKFSTVGFRFVLFCCRIKKSPKLLLRGATPSDVSMLTPSLLDAHSTTQTAQSQTKPPTPRQPPTKRGSNPVLASLPTLQLHPPLPTLPHSHFKLELCVVNILRLQHQTLQITHAWQRGKWLRGRRGMVYRKRKWTLTSAGCRHEIDKWAAASCHAPRHSDDRGPTAKVCE